MTGRSTSRTLSLGATETETPRDDPTEEGGESHPLLRLRDVRYTRVGGRVS